MRRKLVGSSSAPTFCETRAAIGTAETPAEPIRGLIFPFVTLQRSLPNKVPAAVPHINATSPRITILIVLQFKNASALVEAPTDVPRRITTMYIIALEAVSQLRIPGKGYLTSAYLPGELWWEAVNIPRW
jgi:hypothetical protein